MMRGLAEYNRKSMADDEPQKIAVADFIVSEAGTNGLVT